MSTALITGATSGIGAAFARALAADGMDVTLVARDVERLKRSADELKSRFDVAAVPLAADLTSDAGCEVAAEAAVEADVLVNNAGMGLGSGFTANSLQDEERQLDLNVRAVMRLSHAALGAMSRRGGGAVVNVSSVAGFGPTMAGSTYSASKAWVTTFSQTMAPLGARNGVKVMALCPGFVRTEFHERAGIPTGKIPEWLWLDADAVVETALRDLARGKIVSVPSLTYKAIVSAIRHLPGGVMTSIAGRIEAVAERGRIR